MFVDHIEVRGQRRQLLGEIVSHQMAVRQRGLLIADFRQHRVLKRRLLIVFHARFIPERLVLDLEVNVIESIQLTDDPADGGLLRRHQTGIHQAHAVGPSPGP